MALRSLHLIDIVTDQFFHELDLPCEITIQVLKCLPQNIYFVDFIRFYIVHFKKRRQ